MNNINLLMWDPVWLPVSSVSMRSVFINSHEPNWRASDSSVRIVLLYLSLDDKCQLVQMTISLRNNQINVMVIYHFVVSQYDIIEYWFLNTFLKNIRINSFYTGEYQINNFYIGLLQSWHPVLCILYFIL